MFAKAYTSYAPSVMVKSSDAQRRRLPCCARATTSRLGSSFLTTVPSGATIRTHSLWMNSWLLPASVTALVSRRPSSRDTMFSRSVASSCAGTSSVMAEHDAAMMASNHIK